MGLSDEEMRDVFARAEELDRAARRGDAWNAEVAGLIEAGQEVGLSRQAIERALAECVNLPGSPPAVGALTWARSADGRYYVAEVLSTSKESARVRFLRGSEHELGLEDLRPCVLIPGERVVCDWPMWGPWTCTVVAYNADKQRVKLSDGWGYTKSFAVGEVWLAPKTDPRSSRKRMYVTLLGAGAAAGALIGSILTALVLR